VKNYFSIIVLLGIVSLGILGYSEDVEAIPTDYLYEFGTAGTGDGQLGGTVQASLNSNDMVYVVENTNHRVSVFDSDGVFQFTFGTQGSGDGEFFYPVGIAVGPSDNVYVVDKNNYRIQIFDPAGDYLGQFGTFGSADGQFNLPHGIAIDESENLYIADYNNYRIQKFDSNGNHLLTFGSGPGNGPGVFKLPTTIAVSEDGNIYVTDTFNHRVQVFDPAGDYVASFGGYGPGIPGKFGYEARGIGIDGDGNVFVGDLRGHRYNVYDLSGNFIETFGSQGSGPGEFSFPVANPGFDSEGKIYIADSSNNRVQVLGMLEPVDVVDPVVTVSSETVEATSFDGALVSFTVDATDNIEVTEGPTCDVVSGSEFALGDTEVTCTAEDAAGNIGTGIGIITVNSATLQTQKTFAVDLLNTINPADIIDKKTSKGIKDAIKHITKSQDDKNWDTGDTLTKKGHKVFDEEKKAVKSLLKIIKKDKEIDSVISVITRVIDELVRIDSELANNALEDAQAFAGEKKADKEIAKAEKELEKALKELDKGKPDKAIDKYKKVWEHAQHAIKHHNDDD